MYIYFQQPQSACSDVKFKLKKAIQLKSSVCEKLAPGKTRQSDPAVPLLLRSNYVVRKSNKKEAERDIPTVAKASPTFGCIIYSCVFISTTS